MVQSFKLHEETVNRILTRYLFSNNYDILYYFLFLIDVLSSHSVHWSLILLFWRVRFSA